MKCTALFDWHVQSLNLYIIVICLTAENTEERYKKKKNTEQTYPPKINVIFSDTELLKFIGSYDIQSNNLTRRVIVKTFHHTRFDSDPHVYTWCIFYILSHFYLTLFKCIMYNWISSLNNTLYYYILNSWSRQSIKLRDILGVGTLKNSGLYGKLDIGVPIVTLLWVDHWFRICSLM